MGKGREEAGTTGSPRPGAHKMASAGESRRAPDSAGEPSGGVKTQGERTRANGEEWKGEGKHLTEVRSDYLPPAAKKSRRGRGQANDNA